jgi:hypothetical protein
MRVISVGVRVAFVTAVVVASAASVWAQGPPANQDQAASGAAARASADEPQKPAPVPAAAPSVKTTIQRWFDVQTASFLARYRRVESSAGIVMSNHLQDSIALKARFKFDAKGRYSINAGIATGTSFTGGWNNTGLGTGGDRVTNLYLKQLFLAAAPVKGVELTYGGLTVVRGESTEITSYDNDGYVTGERVSVKRPKQLYFDEIAFTNGYLGDVNAPGFTDRYSRLDEFNYRHALVAKRFTKWLGVSGDYTRLSGVGTVRAAFTAKTRRARIVDLVRYEQYRRTGPAPAFGFAAYGEKTVVPRASVGVGYADIDAKYGGLNADRFNKGRRMFEQSTVKITRDLSASLFVTQAVHNAFAVSNRERVDVVVTYNALGAFQRAGLFR